MRSILLALALPALLAAQEKWSEPIERWKSEIEARSGGAVVIARALFDARTRSWSVASGTPQREALMAYLADPEFGRQLEAAHALTVSHRDGDRVTSWIFLNMQRSREWANEDAIIGHELGHAWLKAEGYPTPRFVPGPTACLSVHTGDVVQHILLREEMDRRGIRYRPGWIQDLEATVRHMESGGAPPSEPCQRVQQAALWIDARLGLTATDWPGLPRYFELQRKQYPALSGIVEDIVKYLRDADVHSKDGHRAALAYVFPRLKMAATGSEVAQITTSLKINR